MSAISFLRGSLAQECGFFFDHRSDHLADGIHRVLSLVRHNDLLGWPEPFLLAQVNRVLQLSEFAGNQRFEGSKALLLIGIVEGQLAKTFQLLIDHLTRSLVGLQVAGFASLNAESTSSSPLSTSCVCRTHSADSMSFVVLS